MSHISSTVLEEILPRVTKPLRYVGNELNAVKKDWGAVKLKMLFAFPDIYEVGMSHLGLRILYHLVNDQPDYLMERVFAPWTDMERELREQGLPLFSLESMRPMADFDCLGFTLQYEMSYTNILNMLDLGQIPLLACERDNHFPLVMAGGPGVYNPEPLAEFFDFFVLGEGEQVLLELLDVMTRHRQNHQGAMEKQILLKELAAVPGIYVPAFYEPVYSSEGKLSEIKVIEEGLPARIVKRVIRDMDQAYFPLRPIVPYIETVHDRIMLEVMRGCSRGCRFCQAGMVYRPVRERSKQVLKEQAKELLANTGHNEISLTSLSSSDYSCIQPLLKELLDVYQQENVGVSLPSLRVDSFSLNLAKQVQRVRKTGLTFAPEAGSQRLRDVINKGVTEENLLEVTGAAFAAGWSQVKLYFMIGLPTETEEDVEGIALLGQKVLEQGLRILREQGRRMQPKVTLSVSSFVPKAHTPFQWEGQNPKDVLEEKQQLLRKKIKDRRINYNYHEASLSQLEAVFAKGDRRMGRVLEEAWRQGCKFDSWSEHFHYDTWRVVFARLGIKPEELAEAQLSYEETLPWDHLDSGITKRFLWEEREKAYQMALTGDCRFENCTLCGICQTMDVAVNLKKEKDERDASAD